MLLFTHINTATVEKRLKFKTPPTLIKMAKPTEVFDNYWIYVNGPAHCSAKGPTLGKWLIFKHISCIDQVWETISQAVVSGELGATAAKVSTMMVNPNSSNPNIKVICVYTTAEDRDEVGMKLIPYVRETIQYKTDAETRAGRYACHGDGKVTSRTLEWNKGHPKFKD